MKIKQLQCNFSKHIYLVYNCDEKAFVKFLNDNYEAESETSGALGKTFFTDVPWLKIYIWIDEKQKVAEIIKTIYHEIYHAIVFLFDNCGIGLGDSSGEAVAYLQEDLFEQVVDKLKKPIK